MIYLQEFVKLIYPEELEKLKALELKGVEAKVFDYVLNQKKAFSIAEAAQALKISEAHFRKVHSKLLGKAYQTLSPEEGVPLLRFLARRQLHNLAIHELKKQEKKLLKEKDKKGLEKLFFNSVELFMNIDLGAYDPEMSIELRNKYAEYGKKEPKFKHVILELQEQYHIISVYSRKHAYTDKVRIDLFNSLKPKLKYFEQELLSTGDAIAEFWLYYYFSHHYEHVEYDVDKQYTNLLKALKVYEGNPDVFPIYYYINVNLSIAILQYFNSDFKQAKESFDRIFKQYHEWMKGSIFYVDIYIQLHITLGKFNEAKDLIFFYHRFDRIKPFEYEGRSFGPLAILGLTYLLSNEYEMGYKCVQKAQQLCVKTSFYYLEAMIRIFENSYFFLIGSYDIAEQLTSKNIKFHQYKKCGEEGDFFMGFHRLINAFVRFKFDNKLPHKKYIAVYNGWQESEFAFIGKLLEKMKNSIGLNHWPE